MAPPQILEAEHACGVSCARCGYARAAAYGKVCNVFRSQCLSLSMLPVVPKQKVHEIACSYIIPRALAISTYLSPCLSCL